VNRTLFLSAPFTVFSLSAKPSQFSALLNIGKRRTSLPLFNSSAAWFKPLFHVLPPSTYVAMVFTDGCIIACSPTRFFVAVDSPFSASSSIFLPDLD